MPDIIFEEKSKIDLLQQPLRKPLSAAVRHHNNGSELGFAQLRFEKGQQRIPFIENKCVVEQGSKPILQILELAEVDHEAIVVKLDATEREFKIPIMSMDQSTVSIVTVLAMSERKFFVFF